MSDFLISSYFELNGLPKTGLTPTLRVWEVSTTGHTLVVNNDSMIEVGDGFYKYTFSTYDPNKQYLVISDGGVSLPTGYRFKEGAISDLDDKESLVDAIYEEPTADHNNAGTYGLQFNETKANTDQLVLDVTSLISMVEYLTKFETNRTLIDPIAKTLTVFDDDEVTPIAEFYLRDENGILNIERVVERDPI